MNFKLSNSLTHPSSTVAGVLVGIIIAGPFLENFDWSNPSPAKVCGLIVALATALYGAFYGKKPDQDKPSGGATLPMLVFLCLFPAVVMAQDAPPAPGAMNLTVSTGAVAVKIAGEASIANQTVQSMNLMDFGKLKGNHLSIQSHELVPSSTTGFSIYAAGIGVEPDLSSLMKKTNLPAGSLFLEGFAALGNGIPASGGSHVSALAGVLVKYRASSAVTWNPARFEWIRFGSTNGWGISTEVAYRFWNH